MKLEVLIVIKGQVIIFWIDMAS